MTSAVLYNRLVEAAEHLGEICQHEYVSDILDAADAVAILGNIVATCRADQAQGYHSSLRTYVLDMVHDTVFAEKSA